ncbi:MAG: MoaD/ThiS family protein [Actinobacteria bacterium]|nr:MoaD/ThiS family protein [Actinomycetota bacterium]MCG2803759.1 MoaD/ThiS family protein [Cellulomonas sp.]
MNPVVTVRCFAGGAEAAGLSTESLPAGTVGELVDLMVDRHGPDLQRVLTRCSLLAGGVRVSDQTTTLADGATVDVLPPFAGG